MHTPLGSHDYDCFALLRLVKTPKVHPRIKVVVKEIKIHFFEKNVAIFFAED